MISLVGPVLLALGSLLRSRAALHLEILALRHLLRVLERSRPRRLPLTSADRLLWVCVSRVWSEWRRVLVLVQPDTVVAWLSLAKTSRLLEESLSDAIDLRTAGFSTIDLSSNRRRSG